MSTNPFVKHIRPLSRQKGPPPKLDGVKNVMELRARLMANMPIPEVARWLQEEQHDCLDVTRESLIRSLHKYKNNYIPRGFAKLVPSVMEETSKLEARLEEASKAMDEVEELERLYALQMERIQIDAKNEKDNNKLFNSLSQDIRVAMDILARRAQLKMDLGIEKRHLGQLDVDQKDLDGLMNRYGKPTVSKVLKNAESRRKVLHVAQNIIAFIGEPNEREALLQQLLEDADESRQIIDGEAEPHDSSHVGTESSLDAATGFDPDGAAK